MKTKGSKRATKTFMAKDLLTFFDPETEVTVMAEMLETCRYTLYKWMQNDVMLSEWAADRYAIKIGVHPSEVWSDWFEV
jgi:Mg2+/Co2+ transporter CorC